MDLRQHLGKGIWALIDKSLSGVYGLAVVFLLIGKLPREEYGLYALAFTLVNVALLFNKGFILFPMTKFEAEGVPRPRLLGTTFLFSLCCLLTFGIGTYLAAPLLARIFNAPGLVELLKLTPLILLAFFFRDFSISYLMAHRRIKMLVLLDGIYFVGVASGFALMNSLGIFNRAIVPAFIHITCAAASSLAALIPVLKSARLEFRPSRGDFKRIADFGRYSLSLNIAELTFYQVDLMLLGYFLDPVAVAVYHAAKQPFRFYNLLTQSLNLLIFPGSSKLQAQNKLSEIKTLFEKVIAYYLSGMVLLNLVLFTGAGLLLDLFYGGKYPDSVMIFRILLLFSFFEPLYNISLSILYGLGKPGKAFKPLLVGIPLFIVLNLLLIPRFSGMGAAVAFGLTYFYMSFRLFRALKREIGVSLVNSTKYLKNIPGIVKIIPQFIKQKLS